MRIYRSYCRVQLGEAIERRALGRVGELGQFYDARTGIILADYFFLGNELNFVAILETKLIKVNSVS